MPLLKGSSKKVVSQNISEFHGGKTYAHTAAKFGTARANKQAIAVALSTARRYGKKYAEGGDVDEDTASTDPYGNIIPTQKQQGKFGRIADAVVGGIGDWVGRPGKILQAKPEAETGPMTEEEAFRLNTARDQDANWGAGTALGMVGMGRLPGAAPEGAVGIGGGNLHPPNRGLSSEQEAQLFSHLSDAMAGKNAAPELNQSLDQLYHHITGNEIPKDSPIAPPPMVDEGPAYMVQGTKGGIPIHKTIADTMVADLVDGTKPKDVAKYLFEYAKQDPEGALAAKSILPKQAKSDINKALWSLTKDKSFGPEEKEIINNLYSSKFKAKKAEPEPPPERGGTSGVTPDDIAEYFANEEKHGIGPQWEPPVEKNTVLHPSQKPGDPILDFTDYHFDTHPSPFPERIPITPEKETLAKQWWGDVQHGWHASPAGWENWRGHSILLPEEIPAYIDSHGNQIFKRPEIGIHMGTNYAAHTRIGPYNPKTWEQFEHPQGNPHVIPLVMKHERPLQLPDLNTWGPDKMATALRNNSTIPHDEIAQAMSNKFSAGSRDREIQQINNLRNLLDKHGYDSIRYINQHEDPGSVSFITWHKKNLRNAWAAFKDKEAEALTAGIAGGGVLYPYYRNSPASDEGNGMKKGGRTPMAAGGFNASKWIPRPPNLMGGIRPVGGGMPRAIAPKASPGLIHSTIPGRTDKIPRSVPGGSYIIPASVVSGMGQGNTLAGADALNKLFAQGPYGDKMQKFGTPKPNFGHPMHMAAPQMRMPKPAKAGGVEEGDDHVPIIVAGGEYQVPPEVVQRLGNGNMKQGHKILDELVMHIRRQTIKDMRNEKKPKGSGG